MLHWPRRAHISSTQPNALSVSGSFFIAKEIFIQVGAIFLRDSYKEQEET